MLDASPYLAAIRHVPRGRQIGRLTRLVGLTLEVRGVTVPIGDVCHVMRADGRPLEAEVVGFRDGATLLMPLGDSDGLVSGAEVRPLHSRLTVTCGEHMLGRVLDGLGRPLDRRPPIAHGTQAPLLRAAPLPLDRRAIDTPLPTGISVIDGFLTIGRGQRMGIFSGSGVGKSTLLGAIARETLADVNVIALVGERGREVGAFIDDILGPEGLARSVVIAATGDAPPLVRMKAAYTAVAIAEFFRDQGRDVMLTLDSVTRFAGASREVGLALGEPPTVKGYPPSFFSSMPRLVERLGRTERGSITGLFTVLVDGDDLNDPVADTLRGLLDGHIVLSREIARTRHPAVDVGGSVSRVMDRVTTPAHRDAAAKVRRMLATYDNARDLVTIGAYRPGTDPKIDRAMRAIGDTEALLSQGAEEGRSFDDTVRRLTELAVRAEP